MYRVVTLSAFSPLLHKQAVNPKPFQATPFHFKTPPPAFLIRSSSREELVGPVAFVVGMGSLFFVACLVTWQSLGGGADDGGGGGGGGCMFSR